MPEKRFVNRSVFLAELLRHAVERVLRLQGGMGVGVVWCGSGLRNSCSVAAAGVSVLVSGENWWRMMMMMV